MARYFGHAGGLSCPGLSFSLQLTHDSLSKRIHARHLFFTLLTVERLHVLAGWLYDLISLDIFVLPETSRLAASQELAGQF